MAVTLGAGLTLLLLWAAIATLHNPRVSLAEPLIVERPGRGSEVTVLLGGDFAPTAYAMEHIARHGYRYPFEETAALFQRADVSFANLEAPVTRSEDSFWPYKDWLYKVEPEAMGALGWVGLDVVSLANNHLIDYRERGVRETLGHLADTGIEQVGAGLSEAEARRPVVFDIGGTRVGFLAYLEHKLVFNLYLDTFALGGSLGCAQLNRADVIEDVRRLRPLVDVLVVSVHWGLNYDEITPTQEEYAQLFAELGVDVVAGHHPHDVQAVERIGATVVFYSLGNWAWGARGWPHFRVGLLARLRITPAQEGTPARLSAVEIVPIAVQNRIVDYRPRPLQADEVPWLDPLLAASRERGTELRRSGTTLFLDPAPDDAQSGP